MQSEDKATVEAASPASAGSQPPINSGQDDTGVAVKVPEFMPLENRSESDPAAPAAAVDRFYDVRVPVWAELGRVEMPIGELLKLSKGAVLRLHRSIGEPVDLVSQGVKLARGEVVVVDDCFAVRIKEIEPAKK